MSSTSGVLPTTRTIDRRNRCINCFFAIPRNQHRYSLKQATTQMINVLQSWITPTQLSPGSIICSECFELLQNRVDTVSKGSAMPLPALGHRRICFPCGNSILRAPRTYPVRHDRQERNVIMTLVPLHLVSRMERVCAACWRSATREVQRQQQHDSSRPTVAHAVSSDDFNILLHGDQENIAQAECKTDNKLNKVHKGHKSRNKAVEIEIESVIQTSPLQPNLQSVCRVCLAFDVKMYDMNDFELSEMFQNITGIEITATNHSVTEHLCWECAARLKAAVSFRNKALLSDALLQGLVTTGKEIQKTDITSIKEKNENIKSNLSIHGVFHIVHIEEDGEEDEQSSISENIDTEIAQNTLTEDLIEFEDTKEGIKEEIFETEMTQNIITDNTTHLAEESATSQSIHTEIEQNTIPEESIAFDENLKIKEQMIENDIENYYEPMVNIPIKVEDMEVDAFNIKEEKIEDTFFDPLDKAEEIRNLTSTSGKKGNIPIGYNVSHES